MPQAYPAFAWVYLPLRFATYELHLAFRTLADSESVALRSQYALVELRLLSVGRCNKKDRFLRSLFLVHLQGLEPWTH